ncbi:hypothetical protein FH609_011295 [Streptomyces sp. 3MP-14]|uniref:META domain-containing protein n=1 Tax=Streptomyces mimosae TaxID=2586635 RepID=A0A5N6ADT7_9ACTN|nr:MULTISPECIES: hypothetical protein [Streptomyces]KAB8166987.1 hypothetical protein FH607_008745 [Streptomyces mimosae]KAB8176928.1 hypothetical protein FH609_011295 [Streptomyces sp. 3MP-14]
MRCWVASVVAATCCGALAACLPGGSDRAEADETEPARPAASGELDGVWLTGTDEESAILTINTGLVYFTENQNGEGDTCEGTVENGLIQLESCERNGEQVFTERSAHVLLQGDDLRLTWVSGEQETYTPMLDAASGE